MADNRAEASRLWQMIERARLQQLGEKDIMRNFDMQDYYAPQGVHENVLRRAQAEYARSPSNPLGDNVLEQLPSYKGIDTDYPWLDAMRQVGVNPQPEEGPIWDAALAEQERMREEDAAYAGGASVVNPVDSMYQSYNPAGGWAEAGRLAPDNIAAAETAGWNEVSQPFGGMGGADRLSGASVVAPPRIPTNGEVVSEVVGQAERGGTMATATEENLTFHRIQEAIHSGTQPEAPEWMIEMVLSVPDEDWETTISGGDAELDAFHTKHGFPPKSGSNATSNYLSQLR